MYLTAVLPFLLYHGRIFFYYGDYNVQQVPFYILAHRAVRNGQFFWNPYIDLGSSMGGSLSFYLWGSPFFWLTIPFQEETVPYILPFIMSLRYGTVPIVRETGGLKDTVEPYNQFEHTGTGFSFANYNAHEMYNTVMFAKYIFDDRKDDWNGIIKSAMSRDFSWQASAKKYQEMYDWLIGY